MSIIWCREVRKLPACCGYGRELSYIFYIFPLNAEFGVTASADCHITLAGVHQYTQKAQYTLFVSYIYILVGRTIKINTTDPIRALRATHSFPNLNIYSMHILQY